MSLKLLVAVVFMSLVACTTYNLQYEPIPEDVWESHQRP